MSEDKDKDIIVNLIGDCLTEMVSIVKRAMIEKDMDEEIERMRDKTENPKLIGDFKCDQCKSVLNLDPSIYFEFDLVRCPRCNLMCRILRNE